MSRMIRSITALALAATFALPFRAALYAVAIYLLAFGATTTPSAFIYFQF